MYTDTATGWGRVSRTLHWLTALLVAVGVGLGFWVARLSGSYGTNRSDDAWAITAAAAHHTIGFLVLGLVVLRVNWRLNNPRPAYPEKLGVARRRLAKVTQASLYVLMFLFPISGWAALSAYVEDLPIYFFGWEIPRMYEEQPASSFAHDLFAQLHEACWMVGAVVLSTHLIGAFWSQFGDGDTVINRMWSGRSSEPR